MELEKNRKKYENNKILLLSRYDNLGASSRYRFYQYLPYLRKEGIEITAAPLFDNDYIEDLYAGRKKKSSKNF